MFDFLRKVINDSGLLQPSTSPANKGNFIAHPEEPQDPGRTAANTDTQAVLAEWMDNWGVPPQYRDYWKTKIKIRVYDQWPVEILKQYGVSQQTPAFAMDMEGVRCLYSLASWFNKGVVAHEQAHNCYALLSEMDKAQFGGEYERVKSQDSAVQYLFSINRYGLTNAVEGHAEIYRYIGEQMAPELKRFYPKLF
jgi:hypothetical protein